MKAMSRSLLLTSVMALAGCGTSSTRHPIIEDPERPDEPMLGRATLQIDAKSVGFGEVFKLLAADFTGDGERELVVGGRRLLMLNNDGSERFGLDGWNRPERDHLIGVGWTYDMLAVPNQEGPDDLLVSDADGQAYLVDGSTGEIRWHRQLDQVFGFAYLDVFGPVEDPVLFPHYGNAAYSAKTGEKLWDSPLPDYHALALPMRAGPDQPTDLVVAVEIDWVVGGAAQATASRRGSDRGWIHRISPKGELRWSYALPENEQPSTISCADLDGAGEDSIVVFRFGGMVTVLNPDGTLRWEKQFDYYGKDLVRTFVDQIFARDVDGDGKDELFLVFRDEMYRPRGFGPSKVVALDTEGEELWQFDFDEHVRHAIVEDIAGKPTLLLASGSIHVDRHGEVLALDLSPDKDQRLLKRFQPPFQAVAVAWFQRDGKDLLAVGSFDGNLQIVDFHSGTWQAPRSLGHWIVTSTAIGRQEGDSWVATGDSYGDVRMIDENGTVRWNRRLQVGKFGGVSALHGAALREPGEEQLLAAGYSLDPSKPRGLLEVFSAQGAKLFEVGFQAEAHSVTTADLDGDGRPEILVGVGIRTEKDDCRIIALDGVDGTRLWERPIVTCAYLEIVPGVEGPQGTELAVRADPGLMPVPPFVGMVEPNGEIRWLIEEVREISLWTLPTREGVVFGGATYGHMGYVTRRDRESGEILWQTHVEPVPDPRGNGADPVSGSSMYAVAVGDVNGDGVDEIAMATGARKVILVDGATGDFVWTVQTEPLDVRFQFQHGVGKLAFAPATETTEGLILATQNDPWFSESTLFGISLDGEMRSTLSLPAGAVGAAPVDRVSGISTVAVASGLDVIFIGLHEEPASEEP